MEQLTVYDYLDHDKGLCPGCHKELNYAFSCTYNNKRMCIKCAYDRAKEGSPVKIMLARNYDLED